MHHLYAFSKKLRPKGSKPSPKRWDSLADSELLDKANDLMTQMEIKTRTDLNRRASGLRDALKRRGLMEHLVLPSKHRNLAGMSAEELVSHAKEVIEGNSIKKPSDFSKKDAGLARVLKERNLSDNIGLKPLQRSPRKWSEISDETVLALAKDTILDNSIHTMQEFVKIDSGLCSQLYSRNLVDKLTTALFDPKLDGLTDDELVSHFREELAKNKITSINALKEKNPHLCSFLKKKKLLNRVIGRKIRDFKSMNDDQLIEYAKTVVLEKKVKNRKDLFKKDPGLKTTLSKRGVLDLVFTSKKPEFRNLKELTDDELVDMARKLVHQEHLSGRRALFLSDGSLYHKLRTKRLLDQVFASQTEILVDGVMAALETFNK